MTANIEKFQERNIHIIAIARDNAKKLRLFKEENQFKMPIFPDITADVVKNYRVFTTGTFADHKHFKFRLAIPTTYLINKQGIIVWRFVGTREERPSLDLMLRAIEENLPEIPNL